MFDSGRVAGFDTKNMNKIRGRILIVDDELYIQEVLRETFEEGGFECETAGSVDDAMALLATRRFDIAFTDLRLPRKSGTALLEHINANYPHTIVIMITALDTATTAMELIRKGAYDYIVKPFNLEQAILAANRGLDKIRLESAYREYQRYLEQSAEERAAETRRLFYAMTKVLIRLLEIKTPSHVGHASKVAEMARYLARELKMTEDGVRKVYLAALLHDVGLIPIDDSILGKKGYLTPGEQAKVRESLSISEGVLRPIVADEEVLKYIKHHHERFDGTGYPDGLKGNIVPLGARIIAVVEAFEAMTQDRPYRAALSAAQAIQELHRCSDTQFDPQVVAVFEKLYHEIFHSFDKSPMGLP